MIISLRKPFATDEWGNIVSCMLYTENNVTRDDVLRLKETLSSTETESNDETFVEFVERAVKTHNEEYGTTFRIVVPTYEIDV